MRSTLIIKNTILLYLRMLLIIAANLYTFKLVYNTIGIEGYGMYDLIGGLIMLFSFIIDAMTRSMQRFLTFELGMQNLGTVKKIFSGSLVIHIVAAFLIFVIAELLGYFFLSKLNIPPERLHTAEIVFHFTAITFCLQIIRVPFNATIISYEKMSIFVWVGIVEVVLQLAIALILPLTDFDKLIFYSMFLCLSNIFILSIFIAYSTKKFNIINFNFHKEWELYKKLLCFSGWSLLGSSANVGNQQGTKVLLNVFTNVSVNAAMGVANKISYGIYSLVSSFQRAFEPQLVKLYAQKDDKLSFLIFSTSKLSYFLLLLIVLPFLFNMELLLKLWLNEIPESACIFTELIMGFMLIDAISAPLWMVVSATGTIKWYQIIISTLTILNIPASLLLLSMNYPPHYILVVRVFINVLSYLFRIFYIEIMIMSFAKKYIVKVLLRCVVTTLIILPIFFTISHYLHAWKGVIASIFVSAIVIPLAVYIVGLSKEEKDFISKFIKRSSSVRLTSETNCVTKANTIC